MNNPRPEIMDEVLFCLTNDLSQENLHIYGKINDLLSVAPVCSMLTGSEEASITALLFIANIATLLYVLRNFLSHVT